MGQQDCIGMDGALRLPHMETFSSRITQRRVEMVYACPVMVQSTQLDWEYGDVGSSPYMGVL